MNRLTAISRLDGSTALDAFTVSLRMDADWIQGFGPPREVSFEMAGRREAWFDPPKVKAAIVTCGGLCPGINDVIRSLVRTLCEHYSVAGVLGIRHGLRGFIPEYALDVVELGPRVVADIHETGGSFLGTSRGPQDPDTVIRALERLNVSMLFMIGGNGTMKAAHALARRLRLTHCRLSIVGIPKTVDNDIPGIPVSFGFTTAVERAVDALRCARVEARSVEGGIGLVKLMGRESGFIAAQAALAFQDADLVLIPEVPFRVQGRQGLLQTLIRKLEQKGHALIVAAEGAGQHLMERPGETDFSGNRKLGDIGAFLVDELGKNLRARGITYHFKYIDPGYTVRSVPAGTVDRMYCALLGEHAVHAAMSGRTGLAIARLNDTFVHLPLHLLSRGRRMVNPDSALWQSVLACTGQGHLESDDSGCGKGSIPEPLQGGNCSHEIHSR